MWIETLAIGVLAHGGSSIAHIVLSIIVFSRDSTYRHGVYFLKEGDLGAGASIFSASFK